MSNKCEACGSLGGEYVRVRTTNGGLNLCRQCLDEINAKNPELKEVRASLDSALAALAGLRAEVAGAVGPFVEYARRMDGFDPPRDDDEPLEDDWGGCGVNAAIRAPRLGDCRRLARLAGGGCVCGHDREAHGGHTWTGRGEEPTHCSRCDCQAFRDA